MSDDAQTTESQEVDDEAETETETVDEQTEAETVDEQTEAVLDAEAIERTESVEDLREQIDEQQDRIEELEDLVLDLSTRVADGNSQGVCPDCHGPVVKVDPWIRSAKIKCTDCGRVFHEY
jgi:myo-inositol catabolism protein IolC